MVPSEKTEKCYIYTRVSTAIQVDGYSLSHDGEAIEHASKRFQNDYE